MDIISKLNDELLKQPFSEEQKQLEQLNEYRHIAATYARIENAMAVLYES